LIPNNDQEETAGDAEDAEDCFLITIQAATGARGLNKLFQKKDTGIVDLVHLVRLCKWKAISRLKCPTNLSLSEAK
jgi:hypothetical protein